ncbi:hypothetical protein HID58_066321 [Brassica napus]|uniref:Uncharacterized protein n=2 Tax=Brassica napus TaxID=3708 RepID=A0ABQ7ZFC3_BRANA|nr:hypothetical protein HID58_066321 [Brassica napus]CDY09540.1 BnaC05g23790D [Brassica napus]
MIKNTLLSSSRAMQNQANRRGRYHFAELGTGGLRVICPQCHVPFTPHLGHLIAARLPCKNCKANLSYRSSTGGTVKCPCCSSWRPMPSLKSLVCGGCNATIIYQKDDRSVKCYPCKHITHPQETNDGDSSFYQFVPLQVNGVGPFEVNRVVPQTNPLIPHQVNRVFHPQTNRVNRRNRKANAETESTATSPFTPNPESESTSAFVADYVARLVRDCPPGMSANKRKVEEDKTEPEK